MAKTVITPEQYIIELNKRLPADVQVFLYPEGSTADTALGIDWTNKDQLDSVALVSMAEEQVSAQFEAALPAGRGGK